MATWADVQRMASAFPESVESPSYGSPSWSVRKKAFAWERPLRRSDLQHVDAHLADGPILAVYVADVGVKEALTASNPAVFFTTPHFDGHPSVLLRLDRIDTTELGELIVEAWLARAPKQVAKAYLDALP